ncbi:MAG: hypothetical protein RSC05_12745, partial [Acinetobacter sp.]
MGGSSSQVIGYKYYCGLMVAIGNTIEKLVNINPDNRGWILDNSVADEAVLINKPDLFGGDKQEGGWVGYIDVHTGKPATLEQNHYLAQHDSEIVSAFPNLSYLVYHGLTDDKGFHVVSMSGAMKEVLYWVKRVKIKNDGSEQWYNLKSEIPNRSQIIGNGLIFFEDNGVISPVLNYETKELIGGFETHETASNFPFPELVSSDNVQGSGLENFKQDSKFRIRGAELTRFEY